MAPASTFGRSRISVKKRIEMVCSLANERGASRNEGSLSRSSIGSAKPRMLVSGVRSSCDTAAMNSLLAGLADWARLAHRQCGVRFSVGERRAGTHATGHDGNPSNRATHQSDVAHAAPFLQRASVVLETSMLSGIGHAPKRGDSFRCPLRSRGVGAFGFVDVQRVVTDQLEHLAHAGGLTPETRARKVLSSPKQRYSSAGAQVPSLNTV